MGCLGSSPSGAQEQGEGCPVMRRYQARHKSATITKMSKTSLTNVLSWNMIKIKKNGNIHWYFTICDNNWPVKTYGYKLLSIIYADPVKEGSPQIQGCWEKAYVLATNDFGPFWYNLISTYAQCVAPLLVSGSMGGSDSELPTHWPPLPGKQWKQPDIDTAAARASRQLLEEWGARGARRRRWGRRCGGRTSLRRRTGGGGSPPTTCSTCR